MWPSLPPDNDSYLDLRGLPLLQSLTVWQSPLGRILVQNLDKVILRYVLVQIAPPPKSLFIRDAVIRDPVVDVATMSLTLQDIQPGGPTLDLRRCGARSISIITTRLRPKSDPGPAFSALRLPDELEHFSVDCFTFGNAVLRGAIRDSRIGHVRIGCSHGKGCLETIFAGRPFVPAGKNVWESKSE
jgi:hypothetical protein